MPTRSPATTRKPRSLPPSVERLIAESLAIEAEEAKRAGAIGYMARALVQATLPHKAAEGNEFSRTNGAYTLTILAPSAIGLPYGSVPRLLLSWLATEAIKTRSRELQLGRSMSAFMSELGMTRQGKLIATLKNQTRRLFSSTISGHYDLDGDGFADLGFRVADASTLWWHSKNPEQGALWPSTVTLSEKFFEEVINHPVPVDIRALKALKKSPLALDIYCWATYRMSYLSKPTDIPWARLEMQFGSEYKLTRQFKAAFLDALQKVRLVYPALRAEESLEGLLISPTPPHIRQL